MTFSSSLRLARAGLLAACLMLLSAGGLAAEPAPTAPDESAVVEGMSAPVVVDGSVLFRVRGVSAFPAEKRAQVIAERIVELAADPAFAKEALRIEEQAHMSVVMAGNRLVMGVTDADARLDGIDRRTLATTVVFRIGEAVDAWRLDRSAATLQRNALLALGATLALAVAVWGGAWLYRRLRDVLEKRLHRRIHDVQLRGFRIFGAQQVWGLLTGALTLSWTATLLAAFYLYLSSVLSLFPWTRGLAGQLITLVLDPLRTIGLGLLGALPNLVFLLLLYFMTRYTLKLVRVYFGNLADGRLVLPEFDREWAWPTYRLVRLVLIAFVLIVAYPYIPGSGSEAFKGISIFIGVMFSLGSSSVIGNMIAGYTMTYRRVFKTGDRVRIGDYVGDVEQVRILVTYLRTPKNEVVAIPNSTILNGEVVNYSTLAQKEGLILHTTVGIGYEAPWRQVEGMLLEAAARTPGLRREPPPFVRQLSLGDFCVTYEINAYCADPQAMYLLYTELHRNILDLFNEYGVQIMTPAYEGDPEQPKLVPPDKWYTAPARPPESPRAE
jgi:small-conductance mechanosensitive channel